MYEPSFSYRISNLADIEKIESSFHKSVAKNIRRTEKSIHISNETDFDILFTAMKKTFENQGRRYPSDGIIEKKIVNSTSNSGNGKMFIARDDSGNVHACSYLVYDNVSAYALLGGTDPQYRNSGAKALLWKNEIMFAAQHSKYFDFEGSNIETIENFVRQFGGEQVVNYIVHKQRLVKDIYDVLKPRIKRCIGYKI